MQKQIFQRNNVKSAPYIFYSIYVVIAVILSINKCMVLLKKSSGVCGMIYFLLNSIVLLNLAAIEDASYFVASFQVVEIIFAIRLVSNLK